MDGRTELSTTCDRRAARRLRRAFVAFIPLLLLAPAGALGAQGWPADEWLREPVDDATFETFRSFFDYDAGVPLDARTADVSASDGIVQERLSFVSTPGERVTAVFHRPATDAWRGRPAVVLLHGGSGEGKDGFAAIATTLVRTGINVLAIDMQHFGERRTGLLTTFGEDEKHRNLYNRPATYLAWVTQTVKDVGRAFDFLVRAKGAGPERIGLVGVSRGAQMGVIAAGADPRFRATLVVMGGHFDRLEREHRAAACPANYIGRISPRPLYLVNGLYDNDYDRERSVDPLHRLAREPVEIEWAEVGHTRPPPEAEERAFRWLAEQLRESGGT